MTAVMGPTFGVISDRPLQLDRNITSVAGTDT